MDYLPLSPILYSVFLNLLYIYPEAHQIGQQKLKQGLGPSSVPLELQDRDKVATTLPIKAKADKVFVAPKKPSLPEGRILQW